MVPFFLLVNMISDMNRNNNLYIISRDFLQSTEPIMTLCFLYFKEGDFMVCGEIYIRVIAMNWYKVAEQPNTEVALYVSSWIDPDGVIYPCVKMTHGEWITENSDFLKDSYGYVAPYNTKKLLYYGWVRFMDYTYSIFELYYLGNDRAIQNIESSLYDILPPTSSNRIEIFTMSPSRVAGFKWNEFIESGMNLMEFIRSEHNSKIFSRS